MNRARFRRIPGLLTAISATLVIGACNYGFQGGGGFPSDIRTIYIEPFENQTAILELDQPLYQVLTDGLPRALGGRLGAEATADAIIRGKILKYDNVGQNYTPGQTSGTVQILTQQVTITIGIEIIDKKRNVILWESQSIIGRGEWRQDSQQERTGREVALKHILQLIVDGAQSQW